MGVATGHRIGNILGLPTRTPTEIVSIIDAIRAEMAAVGHWLAERHGFVYPHELEAVVNRTWQAHKEFLVKR